MKQWCQKPDKVRGELDMQVLKQTVIRDGETVTVHLAQLGKALRIKSAGGDDESGASAQCPCLGDSVADYRCNSC